MVKKFIIFLASLIPATVLAGFQVVDETDKPSAPTSASVPAKPPKSAGGLQLVALSYIGDPDSDIPVVSGFGRDLKLLDAVKQIAPAGWDAFLKDDLGSRTAKVNWKGGRRWVEVLDILANEQNLSIDVAWKKKQLYIGERKAVAQAAALAMDPLSTGHWKIRTGENVSEAFIGWSKSAGWQLAWEAPELIAQVDIDLESTFEEAITKVVDALNRNGSGLQAKFYSSNHVLRIMERK